SYYGSAQLTFKDTAPPMRFTVRLARMPGADLSALSLTSGSLSLQVGHVSTTTTTRYFDAKGRAQDGATGAAYTLNAKRADNGEIDLQVVRAAGAAMGKTMTVTWSADYGRGKLRGFIEK